MVGVTERTCLEIEISGKKSLKTKFPKVKEGTTKEVNPKHIRETDNNNSEDRTKTGIQKTTSSGDKAAQTTMSRLTPE